MNDNQGPGKLYEYKWMDNLRVCRVCNGSKLYAGSPCGKCNGHGEYYVARLYRRKKGTEQWIPVSGRWQS